LNIFPRKSDPYLYGFIWSDRRHCRYLLPVRIAISFGDPSNTGRLLSRMNTVNADHISKGLAELSRYLK